MAHTRKMGPPIDTGWAWMCLLGSFIANMIVVGGFKSLGIFLVEFLDMFQSSTSVTALFLGIMGLGLSLLAPVANAMGERFSYRIVVMCGGLLLAATAFVTAFATSIVYLILVFGLFSGIGYGLCYSPSIVVVGQYFSEKRSLATGIAIAGGSIGQLALPPLMRFAVDTYTVRGAMFIFAAYSLHLVLSGALYRPFSFYTRGESLLGGVDEVKVDSVGSDVDNLQNDICVPHEHDTSVRMEVHNLANPPGRVLGITNADDASKGNTSVSKVTFHPEVSDINDKEISKDANVETELLLHENSGNCETLQKSQSMASIASDVSETSVIYSTFMSSTGSVCIMPHKKKKQSKVTFVVPLNSEKTPATYKIKANTSGGTEASSCNKSKSKRQPLYEFSLFCKPLFTLYIICVVLGNSGYINPLLFIPAYAVDLGATRQQSSLLVSIIGATDFVGRIASGWFGNLGIFQRYKILAFCQFITGAVMIITQFFPSYTSLIVLSVAEGLMGGSALALMSVVLVDFLGVEKLSSGHGLAMMCIGLNQMIMPTLIGLMRDGIGSYKVPFILCGACLVLAALLLSLKPLVSKYSNAERQEK